MLDTAAIRRRRASVLSPDAMNWTNIESFYPIPSARTAPRFTSFLRGANGEMWLRVFTEDVSAPASYVVVNRGGAPIGRVTMPRRMVPLDVGSADVVGVLTDDDGLEHVVRYALAGILVRRCGPALAPTDSYTELLEAERPGSVTGPKHCHS